MNNKAIFSRHRELHGNNFGSRWRDFILGWQDGLVNVLGVILGVATATANRSFVIIAALAATFAESISMAAVAYTSFKAEKEYYNSELEREKREIKEYPDIERREVRDIYAKQGFTGSLLNKIVNHVTKDKKRWLKVMMEQEIKILPSKVSPFNIAAVVGFSALFGSLIPIVPYFLFSVKIATYTALIISAIVLFCVGFYKAKTTVGNPWKSGAELAMIGMLAALVGYAIGAALGATMVG